ncbi:MAG: hypothetical protein JO118_16980 [Acetobacteraceae bacterium]|nr:hypothetical protein [Acetobacteraceae bacterium]MBV9118751.1 hypothetical protein [Acetobacteraceae bacterium]MBV9775650.1 hypothetical protein [Acetobacteraceae bacterium]
MVSDWNTISPELQLSLSREALSRARHVVGAQAALLAEQMDEGRLPNLGGSDALRLLAAMLASEPARESLDALCS